MKLSELAYNCVKNVYYTSNTSFSYDLFKFGGYDSDSEFDLEISNVFAPINEAISRLNILRKIPRIIVKVRLDKNYCADVPERISIVEGVGYFNKNKLSKYKSYAFSVDDEIEELGNGEFRTLPKIHVDATEKEVYVEGMRKIPFFKHGDYYYQDDDLTDSLVEGNEEHSNDRDPDLFVEYGISDDMCSYIIEYVAGRLWEVTDIKVANMHRTIAEHYFADMPEKEALFKQKAVEQTFKIGY